MADYPVVEVDLTPNNVAPAGSHWDQIDELRQKYRFFKNSYGSGYWVLTRYDDILEAYRRSETFSNQSIVPVDPNPVYRMLPSMADPPVHALYRKLLNRWFAPAAVQTHAAALTALARDMISDLVASGECDYMATYADRYPVHALLTQIGLPLEDADLLLSCIHRISGKTSAGQSASKEMQTALSELNGYWSGLIEDRRRTPRDRQTDLVTDLTLSSLGSAELPDADILDILITLTHGALDTTKSALGWCMYHLAKHPDDRTRIVADPGLIPGAVEEFLRAYPLVSLARKVTENVDFHGCPLKKGEMVLLSSQSACRDPGQFADPAKVDIERSPNRHIAFGASRHRCLGSHLARAELVTSVRAWHKQIPEYHINTTEPLLAAGGQIALLSLPLNWQQSS
jgi:cytochrome P450